MDEMKELSCVADCCEGNRGATGLGKPADHHAVD
jgi:hypothetical protein